MNMVEYILLAGLVISNVFLWVMQLKTTKRLLELVELLLKERKDHHGSNR